MSQNAFARLRLAQPAAVLAAALGGGGVQAASVSLPTRVTAGSVRYGGSNTPTPAPTPSTYGGIGQPTYAGVSMIVGPGGTSGSSVTAYGIGEATLLQPAARGTTTAQTDAFDRFAQMRVNGTFFTQPGGQVDVTTTTDGAFVSSLSALDIGGIDTTLDYFMDGDSPTLRVLASFTNTTGADLAAEVLYGGNLGSDDNTRIEASSSGDDVFQQADRWFISSDGSTSPGEDPVLTFVRYGEGSVQAASDTYAVPGTPSAFSSLDYFTDVWSLDLGAGATQSLMWFVQFSDFVATAEAGTDVFADLDSLANAGLLAAVGGGSIDTANIVNWAAPTADVPVPGALWLMGAGLFGLAALRRRRRG